MWNLAEKDRWRLYRRWMLDARESCDRNISNILEEFDREAAVLKRIKEREDYLILRDADVIGMTTTGNIYGLN